MNKQTQKELLDIVKRNYEAAADEFNETRKKYLWPELLNLAKPVKDGDKILDAGCGNGRLLKAFQEKKINYLGFDSSENLIAKARKEYINQNMKANIEFREGNILELSNFPELNFDYIFTIAVLHHLPGLNLRIQALKQLKNKISANGKIIITVWNLWSQPKYPRLVIKFLFLRIFKKNRMEVGDILFDWKNFRGEIISRRYYHAFTKRGLKKIAKKAGLKIEKIYKDKYNYYLILTK